MTYANRMQLLKPSAIRELQALENDPEVISFCGGYPDPAYFPREALAEAYQIVASSEPMSLQYANSQGDQRLREQIVERMKKDGVECDPSNILVLQGAQQGLDLVARLLINAGDVLLTEAPTFLGALIAFNPCEPTYVGVPIDDHGLIPEKLEAALKANPGAKMLYVMPDFQNPTGVTLPLERRKQIVELANKYGVYILEDSPYRDIRYTGDNLPTLKQFDTEGRVIFLGSFSKSLAPGLRLGWAVADSEVIQQLLQLKQAADTQTSTMNMRVVSTFLERFDFDKHIANLRNVYGRKRDLMLAGLQQHLPDDATFSRAEGGLFTWLQLPPQMDSDDFLKKHLVPKAKVAYVPGVHFFPATGERPLNFARISFSCASEKSIVEGVARLGEVLRNYPR
ncbi:PLP-dependent aminotransferase family protein [Pseudomonas kermanshahensis]|uniref:aminotransferase-like domain-containing protein n=1 Tax=Pseudomonas kermanshahensis TaxID=2745482 RepID=UPI0023DB0A45|nr:PLP-dependent aminotransferase family protein [Pseudomonas kermanshahensis]WEL57539.1 PLP-dependent aminotransferase family protein [Pseudomonas kermanshahensis]